MKCILIILLLLTGATHTFSVNLTQKEETPSNFCSEQHENKLPQLNNTIHTDSTKSFYWALKTNGYYNLLLVPNVGIEFGFNKVWSINANWAYAWWDNNRKHNYWRIYGGDLELRYWVGKKAELKPLQGHHIGVYGQMLTYDFEFGGRGYLGDKWSYAGGLSYGYSHPVGRRLNLDFAIGIGFLGGKYKEYIPIDDCYVWQTTKHRHWFGPTKLEISIVWLLGRDNYNKRRVRR